MEQGMTIRNDNGYNGYGVCLMGRPINCHLYGLYGENHGTPIDFFRLCVVFRQTHGPIAASKTVNNLENVTK